MAKHTSDIACLAHLANILVDAGRLYARAARIADDQAVIDSIERTMVERHRLLTEIRSLIISFRGEQRDNGTFLGAAHKAFLNARAIFENDEKSALAEVQRGERYLCAEVRKAIRNDALSAETRAFLGLALDRVVNGEMRIEGKLEEVARTAKPETGVQSIPPHG